ncbi:MAG: THUMP domain-containing class I SAM-dependent RNA methyltransferase [Maritimibacter sp.]
MTSASPPAPHLDIFLVAPPGLEPVLAAEALEAGFLDATAVPGGVSISGGWDTVWRANLVLRGATRVLVRIGGFRAFHLAQLDKRARKFDWGAVLRPDVPVRVQVSINRKSKIYHAGAAAQRIEKAITEELGAPISDEADVQIKARFDDNFVTFSVDSSGESLHKRGHKTGVGKAPIRETLAALFLRQMGYDGREPVLDPMCGSGTFVIEAADWAKGALPGRARHFAFETFATFDAQQWEALRRQPLAAPETHPRFFGSDRNEAVVKMAQANARAAGLEALCDFRHAAISELERPPGPPGLIMVNPPYGTRIGNKKLLYALYGSLGSVLKERFSGWRVGIVTSDESLARATDLPFDPPGAPVPHGGLKIRLYATPALR